MNFPLEYPLFQFFYWFVNTAGIGGIFSLAVAGGSVLIYSLIIRWILAGGRHEAEDAFSFPTPALHREDHD